MKQGILLFTILLFNSILSYSQIEPSLMGLDFFRNINASAIEKNEDKTSLKSFLTEAGFTEDKSLNLDKSDAYYNKYGDYILIKKKVPEIQFSVFDKVRIEKYKKAIDKELKPIPNEVNIYTSKYAFLSTVIVQEAEGILHLFFIPKTYKIK
jgi:hypothetical protein